VRRLGLLNTDSVAINGSKFKAVNNRDRNFTQAKVERRRAQIEESVADYLQQLDTADRHESTEALAARTIRLQEKIVRLEQEMQRLAEVEAQMLASPKQQISLTDPDASSLATSGVALGWWATTCRWQWRLSTIWSWRMRSPTMAAAGCLLLSGR